MNIYVSKYKNRNSIARKAERIALKLLVLIIIPMSIVFSIIYNSPKILSSLPVLLSLSGLLQLEVCGLFDYVTYLEKELKEIHDNTGCSPSNIARAIYEFNNPEPGIRGFINSQLYFNKRIGFYFLLIGGLLQLFIIYSSVI